MSTTLGFFLCLLISGTPATAAEGEAVPAWFKSDPAKPYAIFDAWRNLSTTEAVIVWGSDWNVFAGCLQDEHGKPIGNCPLWAEPQHGSGSWFFGRRPTRLKTDKDGYFIIYSPYPTLGFAAAPGYPFSEIGLRFAQANDGFVGCDARVVHVSNDRRFFVLTCPRKNTFDEKDLNRFVDQEMAKWKSEGHQDSSAPLRPWQRSAGGRRSERVPGADCLPRGQANPVCVADVLGVGPPWDRQPPDRGH